MAVVVVGGHTRNIGKTTAVEQILRATPDLLWTAIKITQFGHGVCSANGEPCDCDTGDHAVAISEERNTASGTDTSRMLAAGARRVLWARTRQGNLAEAMPRIRKEMGFAANVLIESNSVLRFLRPDLYVAVMDGTQADFKPTALRYLDRADLLLTPDGRLPEANLWTGVSPALLQHTPVFKLEQQQLPEAVVHAVRKICAAKPATPANPLPSNSERLDVTVQPFDPC